MVLPYYLKIHKADIDKCSMLRIKMQKLRTFVFIFLSLTDLLEKKRIRFENTPRLSPTIHILWCRMYSVPYCITL